MPVSKKETGECPVDATMRVMDGRWKATILDGIVERDDKKTKLRLA
jgi:DNA-binding HxlR family transcriptional regulator